MLAGQSKDGVQHLVDMSCSCGQAMKEERYLNDDQKDRCKFTPGCDGSLPPISSGSENGTCEMEGMAK